MSIFTWGLQPKNQTDPETVEEAITRLIGVHEHDPTSHLGENESIEAHRNSEVIDHLAESIVTDKIKSGQLLLEHFSQSRMFQIIPLTSLVKTGAATTSFFNAVYGEVITGSTINTWYYVYAGNDDLYALIGDQEMSPRFRMRLILTNRTSSEAYFGLGDFSGDSALGFKITSNTLKAVWWDSTPTEHLISIAGINLSNAHNYEAYLKYGEYVRWYVDGVQVAELLWADITDYLVCAGGPTVYVRKTTSSMRLVAVYQIFLEQDYF